MDRKDLESATVEATYLRGLLAVPIGLLFLATGLGNLRWGPLESTWAFVAVVAGIGALYVAIGRFYNDHYGRVAPLHRRQVRDTVVSAVTFGGALVAGPILDFRLDLPISLFCVLFGAAMLAWFAATAGLRTPHLVLWGGLVVGGLLPVWGGLADRVSVAWLPIGAATIAVGLFDHRALTRTFGAPHDLDLAESPRG